MGLHRRFCLHDYLLPFVWCNFRNSFDLQFILAGCHLVYAPKATLTLPGIAAMALTLGMAVDANVLINERIREKN